MKHFLFWVCCYAQKIQGDKRQLQQNVINATLEAHRDGVLSSGCWDGAGRGQGKIG